MNETEQREELEENVLPLHSGDHKKSVWNYADRINFEFASKDTSNINLIMNNCNKNLSVTTPGITISVD